MKMKVGIIGATGYTGIELLRILQQHPAAEICYASTESYADKTLEQVYRHLTGSVSLTGEKLDLKKAAACCDLLFIALPHGHAAAIAQSLLDAGKKVIDLGADFRLKNPSHYQQWYQHPPAAEHLLQQAVYGLPEVEDKATISQACLIANPGCYATAAILAAFPALTAGIVDLDDCIFDGKSGISGAGRTLSLHAHFCEIAENFKAYQTAGKHRHTPEIEQALSSKLGKVIQVQFTPHLIPMIRGLFMTAYFKLTVSITEAEIYEIYQQAYADQPFIRIFKDDTELQTKNVRGSNFCDLVIRVDSRTNRLIVTSAIDNLIKGAAGQAIQNMNLMYALPETLGLNTIIPIYP